MMNAIKERKVSIVIDNFNATVAEGLKKYQGPEPHGHGKIKKWEVTRLGQDTVRATISKECL